MFSAFSRVCWAATRCVTCRTFEVDIRNRTIRNLSRAGSVHKNYRVADIEKIERVHGQKDAIDMKFKSANHSYRLIFAKKESTSSIVMRERFYQVLCLLQCRDAAEHEENAYLMEALDAGFESVRTVVGSFNLGAKCPPNNLLEDFLPLHDSCDLYVVGVQECCYKPVGGDSCDSDWLFLLNRHFAPQFVLLGSHSIQHTAAIKLAVFVNRRNLFKIRNLTFDAHPCGVANVYGNKGAVGCRFYYNETPLTFINVHLAAHEGAAHERNLNTASILNKLNLGGHPNLDVLPQSTYLFYLGDMNYRVGMEYHEAVSRVCEGHSSDLVEKDELMSEISHGNTLTEMKECKISFAPTYRYNVPRRSRELSFSDKKNQTPSFTDRILYHVCPESEIEEVEYCSVPEVTSSDHIPVRATFDLMSNLPFSMNPGTYLGETKRLIKFNYIEAQNILLTSPLFSGSKSDCSEVDKSIQKEQARHKQSSKSVNISIRFYWPFGFDGKCKTSTVEASAMVGAQESSKEAEGHSLNAHWGEGDICKLFPRVMCTEQLGGHPLAFQVIENRPTDNHIIGAGKLSLVKAATHMHESDDSEIVVETFIIKHGIRRGNVVFAFTTNLEYY